MLETDFGDFFFNFCGFLIFVDIEFFVFFIRSST